MVRYADKSSLLLKLKNGKKSENEIIQINIDKKMEPNHPAFFYMTILSNPVICVSPDFSQFSVYHTKSLFDYKWEWDQYEAGLLKHIEPYLDNYTAISGEKAVWISWELFLKNYDLWLANFLSCQGMEWIYESLAADKVEEKLKYVSLIEDWLRKRHEKVFVCWKNLKTGLESRNYAHWLAEFFDTE